MTFASTMTNRIEFEQYPFIDKHTANGLDNVHNSLANLQNTLNTILFEINIYINFDKVQLTLNNIHV